MAAPRLFRLVAALVLAALGIMILSRRVLTTAGAGSASAQADSPREVAQAHSPVLPTAAVPADTRTADAARVGGDARSAPAGSAWPPLSSAIAGAASAAPASRLVRCPLDCSGVGTCDEVTGQCACPLTRAGPSCAQRTLPACEVVGSAGGGDAGGESVNTINLSLLATQPFWNGVPNLASGKEPPVRYLGPLPCACLLQAVAALAGAHTGAFAPWWGSAPDMIYLARVPCLQAPADVTVGALARAGAVDGGAAPRWAAVAVFGWDFKLANNPFLLLPPLQEQPLWAPARWEGPGAGAGAERPSDAMMGATWVAALQADVAADGGPGEAVAGAAGAAAPRHAGVRAAMAQLPAPPANWRPPILLRPAADCPGGCAGAGWCVAPAASAQGAEGAPHATQAESAAGAGAAAPRCECFSDIGHSLDAVQQNAGRHAWARGVGAEEGACAAQPEPASSAHLLPASSFGSAGARFGVDRWRRWHWDRHYDFLSAELPDCPNSCSSVGRCSYGFCACPAGRWGLDCGMTRARALAELSAREQGQAGGPRPRIFVYNMPAAARRACSPWVLPELVGDALLRSEHVTAFPASADFYWVYGCSLAGSLIMHRLDWARLHAPHWNRTVSIAEAAAARRNASAAAAAAAAARAVRAGGSGSGGGAGGGLGDGPRLPGLPSAPDHLPLHLFVSPSEHGWAEAWQAVWFGRGVHSPLSPAHLKPGTAWWRAVAPDSPERLVGSLQLEGAADTRFKRELPPCHLCFQRRKDVMIPTFKRTNDYPSDADCARLRRGLSPWSAAAARSEADVDFEKERSVAFFFAGAIQTRKDVQPSRYEFWRLWRNASGFRILQTERHPLVVDPADGWSEHVDLYAELRRARTCMVPLGKTGNYGQRMIPAALAGCIPVMTKPEGSAELLEEALPWPRFSLRVPHERAAELGGAIAGLDRERRRAMQRELGCAWRRLLWTRIYGTCIGTEHVHLGEPDAFDTLMDALRRRVEGLPPAASACEVGPGPGPGPGVALRGGSARAAAA